MDFQVEAYTSLSTISRSQSLPNLPIVPISLFEIHDSRIVLSVVRCKSRIVIIEVVSGCSTTGRCASPPHGTALRAALYRESGFGVIWRLEA